jgi:hypothetical protein
MSDTPNPLGGIFKPLGDTAVELLKLPMDLARDNMPDLQNQIKDMPNIVRENVAFFSKQMHDLPKMLQDGMASATKGGNAPLAMAQAISPLPLFDRESLEKMRDNLSKGQLPPPPSAPSGPPAPSAITIPTKKT